MRTPFRCRRPTSPATAPRMPSDLAGLWPEACPTPARTSMASPEISRIELRSSRTETVVETDYAVPFAPPLLGRATALAPGQRGPQRPEVRRTDDLVPTGTAYRQAATGPIGAAPRGCHAPIGQPAHSTAVGVSPEAPSWVVSHATRRAGARLRAIATRAGPTISPEKNSAWKNIYTIHHPWWILRLRSSISRAAMHGSSARPWAGVHQGDWRVGVHGSSA